VDQKRLKELLNNPLLEIYLFDIDGKIVGMGSLHYFNTLVKKSVWIEDVVVHPEHQGKGHGKKITEHLISEAKKKRVKHIDLSSRNDRVKAHKFYQKLDFEKRDTSIFRRKLKK
jgi:ribosomal protein S18 acetylase RimI-like enzyme